MKIEIELDNLTKEEQEIAINWANRSAYWIPKFGEYYFYLDSDGSVNEAPNEEDAIDEFNIATGNFFHNVEEAREYRNGLKMKQFWKELAAESFVKDNSYENWYVIYDRTTDTVDVNYHRTVTGGEVCFSSKQSLRDAIARLGAENVKKYILGITEEND